MDPYQRNTMSMRRLARWTRLLAVAGVVGAAGCKSLDVTNPNAPDAETAFSDPDAIAGLVTGGFRAWANTHESYSGSLLLSTMADAHSASWNNFNIRYYSSYGVECPERCGWVNNNLSPFRVEIEAFWYGYYSVMSSALDVLTAIRINEVEIGDADRTHLNDVGANLLQAMAMAEIAMNYDQGYAFDENVERDANGVPQVGLVPRTEVRDSALSEFEQTVTLIEGGDPFTTPSEWTGAVNGPTYSSAQLVRIIRTMQARLIAYFPRTAAENTTADWGSVATFAAGGLTSATPFEFAYYQDGPCLTGTVVCSGVKNWGNDITTTRVDTRLAALIAPESQQHPWPEAAGGNPQPSSADNRVGNGTWGPEDDFLGVGTLEEDAGAGTDFAWAEAAIFLAARGQFHQSNLGHIRYSYTAYPGYGLPSEDGTGEFPVYSPAMNDLLWAEGLIRSGGSLATAATLINNTRVDRGGLPAASAADGVTGLLEKLQYEQEIELLGIGASPFYNRRRIDGLHPMTPRHQPVPAKELTLIGMPLYSFGGPGNPEGLAPPSASLSASQHVRDKAKEIMALQRASARGHRRQ
jgi:hypothetical protein